MLGTSEIMIIVILIVLLLFGPKKIPELMRGIGKGMREFKSALKGETDDDNAPKKIEDDKKSDDKS